MARCKSRAAASGKPLGSKKSVKVKLAKGSRTVKKPRKKRVYLPPYSIPFQALPAYDNQVFREYPRTLRSGNAYCPQNTTLTVFERNYHRDYSAIKICILLDHRTELLQEYPVFLIDTDMDDREDILHVEVRQCETHEDILFQVIYSCKLMILFHTI